MTFSNYWRYSRELASNPKVGEEKPGRDGIWIEVCTYGKDGTEVLKALKMIVSRLQSAYPTEPPKS